MEGMKMQKVRKLSVILLALTWWLTAMLPVFAATKSQDGMEITVTADRQKYSGDQKIGTNITVKNNNAYAVTDVTVESIVPGGYRVKDGDAVRKLETLSAGETVSLAVDYVPAESGGGGDR